MRRRAGSDGPNISLVLNADEELPVIETDERRLRQAVKFTPDGGSVTLEACRGYDSVILRVSDTGIGIAEGDIPRCLAPFGQVDSTVARKYGGAGFGLSISKKLLELLDGRFGIRSEVGRGTVVAIELPIRALAHRTAGALAA